MRLYELAKIHGVDRKQLLTELQKQGFDIKNDIASVEDDAKDWVETQAAKGFPTLDGAGGARIVKKKKSAAKARTPQATAKPVPAPAASESADTDDSEESSEMDDSAASGSSSKREKKDKRKKMMRLRGDEPEPSTQPDVSSQEPEYSKEPTPSQPLATEQEAPEEIKEPETAQHTPKRHGAEGVSSADKDRIARFEALRAKAKETAGKKDTKTAKGTQAAPKQNKPNVKEIAPQRPAQPATQNQDVDPESLLVKDESDKAHTGEKHKRADFKQQRKIAELPPMFANLDAEYTRSIRGGGASAGRRRGTGSRGAGTRGRSRNKKSRFASNAPRERDPNQVAEVAAGMTLRELSVALGVKLNEIIALLMKNGQMALANDIMPEDTITLIAEEFDVKYDWKAQQDLEQELEDELQVEAEEADDSDAVIRPPIITFMGHVDHGKTSLLDKIRETRVTDGEAGGITQHIGAYSIMKNNHPITFLDTPGHEAFTAMRARGANITDVVVLVVAADDGVMPQTKEACSHARNANVPIIVAINKIDIAGANPDRVRQELAQQLELLPEEWGGKVGMVEVSAITGQGVNDLLERILLEAEMLELKAHPKRNAIGHVVESKMSESRGVETTVVVKDGTLSRGDVVLCSNAYGKVKLMFNATGKTVDQVGPGYAASITGLNNVPEAGDTIYVLDDILKARAIAEQRERDSRAAALARRKHVTLDNLTAYLADKQTQTLNVILKADVQGSLEVLQNTLTELSGEEVKINVIHSAVGGINQADVILADASDALIIGFHVVADQAARLQAASHDVQIKVYHIIYRIVEDMKAAISGMLPPEEHEVIQGHIEVRQVFKASRIGNIAGCYVNDGIITRTSSIRLIRDNIVIYDGEIEALKRFKDDVKEVRSGFECGITLRKYDNIQEGDSLEAYTIESIARTLE